VILDEPILRTKARFDKRGREWPGLKRLARGTDEIAEYSDVGAIGADAASIHGQAEVLGKFEIDTGIIEFREAEARSGEHAVEARRINGAWRPMALPRTARQLVELLPIAFVPGIHLKL
jgi:hypothetical protein